MPTEAIDDVVALKGKIHRLVDSLPNQRAEAIEELQYRLYVLQKIENGLRDIEAGRVVSHEEAKRRLSKWLTD